MQRLLIYILLLLFPTTLSDIRITETPQANLPECAQLYSDMGLHRVVSYNAFRQAHEGYSKLNSSNGLLTLIDYSKPSTEERLYVLDMQMKEIIYSSHVSHGRNSGMNYATSFSNEPNSYKSSLGFFRTANTYIGRNGYSLVLEGLEKGINDKARERAIVMHGASYSNPDFITYTGRLGRSQGCPALPVHLTQPIINTIKGGSLIYIYAESKDYELHSHILYRNT